MDRSRIREAIGKGKGEVATSYPPPRSCPALLDRRHDDLLATLRAPDGLAGQLRSALELLATPRAHDCYRGLSGDRMRPILVVRRRYCRDLDLATASPHAVPRAEQ